LSYDRNPPCSFWDRCQADEGFLLESIYVPQVTLGPGTQIVTAGSCFAQKIGQHLRQTDAALLDLEPLPQGMRPETGRRYGYGLYSARYGNIYTSAQLLQLAEDAFDLRLRPEAIWRAGDRWIDGLRPRIEPEGFESRGILEAARLSHLGKVRQLLVRADVLIFTLGLTERWQHAGTGTVFPVWPGVVRGAETDGRHVFVNARVAEIVAELDRFIGLVRRHNPAFRVIFTVSPVPLAATATGGHVLAATVRSKAVLRAAVDEILHIHGDCDYFPSYEIATANPRMRAAFGADEREVSAEAVGRIMGIFLAAHPALGRLSGAEGAEVADAVCEEVLLRAAGP
jgi:hypothetical protein